MWRDRVAWLTSPRSREHRSEGSVGTGESHARRGSLARGGETVSAAGSVAAKTAKLPGIWSRSTPANPSLAVPRSAT